MSPQGTSRAPVVILGHGIGGQKDMALHGFADRFASNGLAAVIFDYRTFGGSDGEPRHWVSPKRHLEDWTSTIQYVQVRPQLKHRGLLHAPGVGSSPCWGPRCYRTQGLNPCCRTCERP